MTPEERATEAGAVCDHWPRALEPCSACVAAAIRDAEVEAYARGYRGGQEAMRERAAVASEEGSWGYELRDLPIEEPKP